MHANAGNAPLNAPPLQELEELAESADIHRHPGAVNPVIARREGLTVVAPIEWSTASCNPTVASPRPGFKGKRTRRGTGEQSAPSGPYKEPQSGPSLAWVDRTQPKEKAMEVFDLMTKAVKSCGTNDSLQRAAQILWENDCGAVPVVDGEGRVVGMITDRDICMAAYTQGQPLWQIPVSSAMAKQVHGVRENDPLEAVETLMRRVRVRRVPVLDGGGRLKGILSMNDLARHAHRSVGRKANGLSGDSIVQTLAAICEPNASTGAKEAASAGSAVHLRA